MERLQRIARPESERVLRVRERLGAASVAGERPGEHVVAVDRRTLRTGTPRERDRLTKADPVVDLEERRLEVCPDPVRDEQPADRLDERRLRARAPRLAREAI